MTRIFDDIYAYVHPKGANCIVYAFIDGNKFDLLDSGAGASIILSWLRKKMIKDGLDPFNIRNIFHCHVHFDHVGGDVYFQKIAAKYKENVKIYFAQPDAHRFRKNFSIMKSNFDELYSHFPNFPNKKIRNVKFVMKIAEKTVMKYKIPENLKSFNNGEILSIGQRKAKVITTGGHTEGHSFLVFQDSDKIVANSDATCINEFTSDFAGLLRAFHELDMIQAINLFGGHDVYSLGEEKVKKDIHDSKKRIADMLRPILVEFKSGNKINISSIAYKRIGSLWRVGIANTWAHMTPFCIGKCLKNLGVGKLELTPDCKMYFDVNTDDNMMDRIDSLRYIGENKDLDCIEELYKIYKKTNQHIS